MAEFVLTWRRKNPPQPDPETGKKVEQNDSTVQTRERGSTLEKAIAKALDRLTFDTSPDDYVAEHVELDEDGDPV